jgi:hypothetical protein
MPARRGTLVVPAEAEWIIKRCAADLTSRSLRKDLTGRSLRKPDARSWCDRGEESGGALVAPQIRSPGGIRRLILERTTHRTVGAAATLARPNTMILPKVIEEIRHRQGDCQPSCNVLPNCRQHQGFPSAEPTIPPEEPTHMSKRYYTRIMNHMSDIIVEAIW